MKNTCGSEGCYCGACSEYIDGNERRNVLLLGLVVGEIERIQVGLPPRSGPNPPQRSGRFLCQGALAAILQKERMGDE
jgi:hypothetical protein